MARLAASLSPFAPWLLNIFNGPATSLHRISRHCPGGQFWQTNQSYCRSVCFLFRRGELRNPSTGRAERILLKERHLSAICNNPYTVFIQRAGNTATKLLSSGTRLNPSSLNPLALIGLALIKGCKCRAVGARVMRHRRTPCAYCPVKVGASTRQQATRVCFLGRGVYPPQNFSPTLCPTQTFPSM